MPLYEYQCQSCHRHLEKIQKFSDAPLTECPYCGGRLEKTITAPAVQFKGGGWYADLYSSSKKNSSSAKTDASAPASGSSDSSAAPASTAPASTPAPSTTTSSDKK